MATKERKPRKSEWDQTVCHRQNLRRMNEPETARQVSRSFYFLDLCFLFWLILHHSNARFIPVQRNSAWSAGKVFSFGRKEKSAYMSVNLRVKQFLTAVLRFKNPSNLNGCPTVLSNPHECS